MQKDIKDKKVAETGTFKDQHTGGAIEKGKSWSALIERSKAISRNKVSKVHEYSTTKGNAIAAAGNFYGGGIHVIPTSEKISIIKKGISKEELEEIKDQSNLDYKTLSGILSVSKAKLHSKKGAEKFDQNTSERIMRLADVIRYGQSVFEDKDSFNDWLKTNNKALGDKAPIELMDTIYGIDEVKREIGRIEYGVF